MNIIEQAEHELRLLMLCKPSTVRGLIAEIQRLRGAIMRKEHEYTCSCGTKILSCDEYHKHNDSCFRVLGCDCGLTEWKYKALKEGK